MNAKMLESQCIKACNLLWLCVLPGQYPSSPAGHCRMSQEPATGAKKRTIVPATVTTGTA